MDYSFSEFHKEAQRIAGWLFPNEAKTLHELASKCNHPIVDIGTFHGRSASYLAAGSKCGSHVPVYTIDPFTQSSFYTSNIFSADANKAKLKFKENMKKLGLVDIVIPLITTSKEAARLYDIDPELILIDGDHTFDGAKLDFDCWYPKLVPNGVMAVHDYTRAVGAKRLMKECFTPQFFTEIKYVDLLAYGVKIG